MRLIKEASTVLELSKNELLHLQYTNISAIDAEKKALKLNPFLWKSFESLCNLGELGLDPGAIFDLEGMDSLQDCHGANQLVSLFNSCSNEAELRLQPPQPPQLQQTHTAPSNLSRIFQTPQQQQQTPSQVVSFCCVVRAPISLDSSYI